MTLYKKTFENIVGKGENAGNWSGMTWPIIKLIWDLVENKQSRIQQFFPIQEHITPAVLVKLDPWSNSIQIL